MSEPVVSREQSPEQSAEPSVRIILGSLFVVDLLLVGLVAAAHFSLVELRSRGVDPGALLMIRALAGSLTGILLVLTYVLGWAGLLQGWKRRTTGQNVFFLLLLIFGNLIGVLVLCLFDPASPRGGRRAEPVGTLED